MWHGVDPLAEMYPDWSPFAYTMNNPITYVDPTGMSTEDGGGGGEPPKVLDDGSIILDLGVEVMGKNEHEGFRQPELKPLVSMGNESQHKESRSDNLPEITITGSRTNYQSSFDNVADKGDFLSGTTALVPGSFRLTNGSYNGSSFSLKYYSSGWTGGGRARISTYNIGKIGNATGSAFFILGTVNDGIGVYNYYQNPSAQNSNAVNPGKAGLNIGLGLYGMYINPIPAVIYGGLEAFYPGGAAGALEVQARNFENNWAINPNYRPFITGKF